jgi:hypothetical protein
LLSRLQTDAAKISPVLAADFARQHSHTVQDFRIRLRVAMHIGPVIPASRSARAAKP